MKRMALWLLVIPLLTLNPARAAPEAADDFVQQELTYRPQDASTDDYMIGLARAGNINLFADVTNGITDSPIAPYPGSPTFITGLQGKYADGFKPTLQNLIADLAEQKELTHSRFSDRTFLFWSEPDLVELGRQIAAEEKARPVLEPPGAFALTESLMKYLKAKFPEQADDPAAELKIAVSDLPDDLREGVHNETRMTILGRLAGRNFDASSQKIGDKEAQTTRTETAQMQASPIGWFDENFWNTALLKIGQGQIGKIRFPLLYVGGPFVDGTGEKRILSAPVGRLDKRALAAAPSNPKLQRTSQNLALATSQRAVWKALAQQAPANAADLEGDPDLQTRVAFDAKRKPLRDVLAELKAQSQIGFSLSEAVAAQKMQLTAHAQEMPLGEVLKTLAQLYPIEWFKTGDKQYSARMVSQTELERNLFRLGDPHWYRLRLNMRPGVDLVGEEKNAFAMLVVDEAGAEKLYAPAGVLVSSLPEEMQQKLRRLVQEQVSGTMLASYQYEQKVFGQDLYLHYGVVPRDVLRLPGTTVFFLSSASNKTPQWSVRTKAGSLVTELFQGFKLTPFVKKFH